MAVGVHQDLRYLWRLRHMQRGLPRLVWQIDVSTAVYQQLNHVHLVVVVRAGRLSDGPFSKTARAHEFTSTHAVGIQ